MCHCSERILTRHITRRNRKGVIHSTNKYNSIFIKMQTEVIIEAAKAGIKWLHRLFNLIWINKDAPKGWRSVAMVLIRKEKRKSRDSTKCGGISLRSQIENIFSTFLEQRLHVFIESELINYKRASVIIKSV